MKLHLLLLVPALGCAGCANGVKLVRTPPGTSVEVALAKRAEVVRLPGPPPAPVSGPDLPAIAARTQVPAVEPELPAYDNTERVADAYTRGQLCLKTGAEAEAIAAFQEAVKLDPTFSEAWYSLAALYERQGDAEKSIEAFRNAKKIAHH